MSFIAAGALAVTAGLGIAKAIKGGADKRKAKKENAAAKIEMEKAMDNYRNMDTSNPYLNMENTMEDLTVNTQAADMASEQNQIGMADTLGKMNQAAGGSGIAALAQAMANQSQIANQKASVSIATQEKGNQKAERTEASRIQGLEIDGEKYSRRLVMSAWNPVQINEMALPPCHVLTQFSVNSKDELSCALYQRSGDVGLGVPFNIASYSFLTHILARHTGLKAKEFVHFIGDAHIYDDHIIPLTHQLKKKPFIFPKIKINKTHKNINNYDISDIDIFDYRHHDTINMDMKE